jgi:hypothetical protein
MTVSRRLLSLKSARMNTASFFRAALSNMPPGLVDTGTQQRHVQRS